MPSGPLRVRKAFAYVTRAEELLVFRHRDFPMDETGLQVPAGTVRAGESPERAAVREVIEETGLTDLALRGLVGIADYDVRPGRDEVHERHIFHFEASAMTPDAWVWFEEHDGLAEPTAFEFQWIPLERGHVLSAGMGALLGELRR